MLVGMFMDRDITDSGMFDLAEFRASITPAPLEPKHDDTLLGIGSSPLPPPVRDVEHHSRGWMSRATTFVAVLAAFGSVAFALHTRQQASLVEATPEPVPVVAELVETVALAQPPEPEPAPEPELVPEVEPEPVVVGPRRVTPRPASSPAPTPTPSNAPEVGERSVDELMRLATGLPEVPRESTMDASLRTLRPDRQEVARVFRARAAAVRRCAPDGEGVVTAKVFLVGDTGRARSARVTGASSEAVATCMETALMSVEVDPFLQDRLEITFPYRL